MNMIEFANDLAEVLKKHGIKDISPLFCRNCKDHHYFNGMDGYAHIRVCDNGTLEIVGMKIDPVKEEKGGEYVQ